MILDGNDGLGREFDFATMAGRVETEVGNGRTAEADTKFAHDVQSGRERSPEVFDAANKIALEEIVGANPVVIEFPTEGFDGIRRIVDAMEQDGLVVDGDAGVYDACEAIKRQIGQFANMVEMGMECGNGAFGAQAAGRSARGEDFGQLRCEALRKRGGRPRANAQHPERWDGAEFFQDGCQGTVFHQERIAAGNEQILDGWIFA